MIYTTLNKIRAEGPCGIRPSSDGTLSGWLKLLNYLNKTTGDNEPLALSVILESNGLDDTLWCLRSVPEHNKVWRLYAVWCARQVQHLMKDPRSIAALDVAERHANGNATDAELVAAGVAARVAAGEAAGEVAWVAAWAAVVVAQAKKLKELLDTTTPGETS